MELRIGINNRRKQFTSTDDAVIDDGTESNSPVNNGGNTGGNTGGNNGGGGDDDAQNEN